MPTSPRYVFFGNAAVFQDEFASGGSANSQLVFFLADGETGKIFLDQKCGDALVSLRRVDGGEEDEEAGFFGVGDPELAAVEHEVATAELGLGLQSERVRSASGFAQRIGAEGVGGHLGQVAFLLFFIGPAQNRVHHQRVLHVDDDSGGGVSPGEFFHG